MTLPSWYFKNFKGGEEKTEGCLISIQSFLTKFSAFTRDGGSHKLLNSQQSVTRMMSKLRAFKKVYNHLRRSFTSHALSNINENKRFEAMITLGIPQLKKKVIS